MTFAGVNYLAVLAAAAASFMLGWVWYGLLFRNQWIEAQGKTLEDCKDQKMSMGLLALNLLALLVMALTLAGIMGHLGPSGFSVKNGIVSGALVWLGFVITAMATNHAYQGQKRALTMIDGGHWLAVLALQGAVLGLFGI